MNDGFSLNMDRSFLKESNPTHTNPLIKFVIVVLISFALFINIELIKIYGIVFVLILFYLLWPLPYEISKPRYRMITSFSLVILVVQLIFNQNGDLLFYALPFEIGNHGPFIPIYQHGLYQGLMLMGRFWGLIFVSWIFVNSTNPFEFAQSLTKIRIPYRIAFSLSLALRFAPVFSHEMKIIQKAQQARGLNLKPSNMRGLINIIKFTLIPLIGSTLNRILGLTISMEGRAFGTYRTRSYVNDIQFVLADFLKLISVTAVLFVLLYL